jgi:uncharacterized membrane protein HdeD (DUF308 family)
MMIILARNWWALALRGVAAVLFGVLAFAWPGITLGALVILYGAYAMVDGVFAVVAALSGRTQGMPWWAMLLEGLAGIAIGIMTFAWPAITALVLLYLIAAWALVTGVFEIVAAVRLRKEVRGEWLLALSGVLSIIFGVALVANPGAGALAIVWLIGAYSLVFGALLITLAFRLRALARKAPDLSNLLSREPAATEAQRPTNAAR